MFTKPLILAIETSCDDTSAAVISGGRMLSNVVHTQSLHRKYGGVVPELASRAHQAKIIPTIEEALHVAGVERKLLDAIAFTRGPGLLGSLLVGVTTAKALAMALTIPLIEVHHMQAHVLAHFIDQPHPATPFICLTVSGGHTQIILVKSPYDLEILGQTIDDAAGEAFDKAGKMLGLDYPAGPELDRLAKKGSARFEFNKPEMPDFDFSFSGLKTSILYKLRKWVKEDPDFISNNLEDLCASVQRSIVDILLDKVITAARSHKISEIAIAGGVSANSELRHRLKLKCQSENWKCHIPKFEYCTDNAGMIAMAAHYKYLKGDFSDHSVSPAARLEF